MKLCPNLLRLKLIKKMIFWGNAWIKWVFTTWTKKSWGWLENLNINKNVKNVKNRRYSELKDCNVMYMCFSIMPSISSCVFLFCSSLQFLCCWGGVVCLYNVQVTMPGGRIVSMLIVPSKQTQTCFAEHNIQWQCCITIPAIRFEVLSVSIKDKHKIYHLRSEI